MPIISEAVGPGCPNLRDDVLLVQGLLGQHLLDVLTQSSPTLPPIPEVNGQFDAATAAALDWYLRQEALSGTTSQKQMGSLLPAVDSSAILGINTGLSVINSTPMTGSLRLEPQTSWEWIWLSRFTNLPSERGGNSTISDADLQRAADLLKCELAAVKAVAEVESRGFGWIPDGRPKILFEAHIFSKYTTPPRIFDKPLPDISVRRRNKALYGEEGAHQYDRLQKAMAFDRKAALLGTSYGRFQIMGFNFKASGFGSVEAMVKAMFTSEQRHLEAFTQFLKSSGLDKPLQKKQWATFARGYNGSDYASNHYDTKLAAAYTKYGGK